MSQKDTDVYCFCSCFLNHMFKNCLMQVLWRPIFIIVQFVIVSWRELNCVKIPQGGANKSANRWVNLTSKVE